MAALRRGALALCWLTAGCSEIGQPMPGTPDAAPPADAAAGDAAAPLSVTLVLGGVEDTLLDAANPTLNYGGDVTLRADADPARVALLRIDVSAVPAGATVDAAELALTTAADALEQGSIGAFEVTESWAEGDGIGVAAAANWTQRTGTSDWTTAGAGAGSRAASAMSELVPSVAATRYTTAVPTDLVQRWVADPGANHGVVLVAVDAATHGVDFESSESATISSRPSLTITYTP